VVVDVVVLVVAGTPDGARAVELVVVVLELVTAGVWARTGEARRQAARVLARSRVEGI
jgi:hypothetical protein